MPTTPARRGRAVLLATLLLGGCAAAPEPRAASSAGTPAAAADTTRLPPPSSAVLALLPEGEEKRRFILDCTGCHQFDAQLAFPGGQARTRAEWEAVVARMVGMAGAHTPFPVISAQREPASTAEWLSRHLGEPPRPRAPLAVPMGARVTEFLLEQPGDLPHDLAVDGEGRVVITGMFTDRMYRLDPATGEFTTTLIPVPRANPRSLEIDAQGRWWVFLGAPGRIARFDPASGDWASWEVGTYAHEARPDGRGRVWFNGHFSRDPEILAFLDPATGEVRTYAVPAHPEAAVSGPIPYGLRVAPDGSVWGTELQGNRIFRFDPESERFELVSLPTPSSGPRRPAFDAAGTFWIPLYAANRLAKYDPRTRRFFEYALPIPDALPYVAEVDPRTGTVWVGSGSADALFAFDPRTERFTVYPLPSRGALVRHLAIDPRTGHVWAAYGASPGIPARVARLEPDPRR